MVHIWKWYEITYGLYVGVNLILCTLIWVVASHIKPINSDCLHSAPFYCLLLLDCYVQYRIWAGMIWDSPIPIPYVVSPVSMQLLRISLRSTYFP